MKIINKNFSKIVCLLLLAQIFTSAVIKNNDKTKGRDLGGVTLSKESSFHKHLPSRYLKLKKFLKKYSKEAGVQLADSKAKRKLFCKLLYINIRFVYKTIIILF